MELDLKKTSTTITIKLEGIAYSYLIKKRDEIRAKKDEYIGLERMVSKSLRRLHELESMIEEGSLITVQPSVGRVVNG